MSSVFRESRFANGSPCATAFYPFRARLDGRLHRRVRGTGQSDLHRALSTFVARHRDLAAEGLALLASAPAGCGQRIDRQMAAPCLTMSSTSLVAILMYHDLGVVCSSSGSFQTFRAYHLRHCHLRRYSIQDEIVPRPTTVHAIQVRTEILVSFQSAGQAIQSKSQFVVARQTCRRWVFRSRDRTRALHRRNS